MSAFHKQERKKCNRSSLITLNCSINRMKDTANEIIQVKRVLGVLLLVVFPLHTRKDPVH